MPCLGALTIKFELRVIRDDEEDIMEMPSDSRILASPPWSKSSKGCGIVDELVSVLAGSLLTMTSDKLSGRSELLLLD